MTLTVRYSHLGQNSMSVLLDDELDDDRFPVDLHRIVIHVHPLAIDQQPVVGGINIPLHKRPLGLPHPVHRDPAVVLPSAFSNDTRRYE